MSNNGSFMIGKKFILSAFVIVSFAIYALFERGSSSGSLSAVIPSQPAQNSTSSLDQTAIVPNTSASAPATSPSTAPKSTPAATPTPIITPTPVPATKPKGQYTDGTYTGVSANAYYGNIQVQVTISGGKISDVVFLDYPQDRGTSRSINSQAMPYLKQEAIAAQSANVQIVTGATDSSMAFRQSLSSALSQAKS